jgi:ATP-dependent Lon protease
MLVIRTSKQADRLENRARKSRVQKTIDKAQKEEAFKELLKLIGSNGGKVPYGSVNKLVSNYKRMGYKAVTRQNLYYELEKLKNSHVENGTGSKSTNSL